MAELLNKGIGHSYPGAAIRARERRAFFLLPSVLSFNGFQWMPLLRMNLKKSLLKLKWLAALMYFRGGDIEVAAMGE